MLSSRSPVLENASKVSADAVSASLVSPDPLNSKRRLRITAQFYSRNVMKTSDGHQINVLCSNRQRPDSRYWRSAPPSATVFVSIPAGNLFRVVSAEINCTWQTLYKEWEGSSGYFSVAGGCTITKIFRQAVANRSRVTISLPRRS